MAKTHWYADIRDENTGCNRTITDSHNVVDVEIWDSYVDIKDRCKKCQDAFVDYEKYFIPEGFVYRDCINDATTGEPCLNLVLNSSYISSNRIFVTYIKYNKNYSVFKKHTNIMNIYQGKVYHETQVKDVSEDQKKYVKQLYKLIHC